jgi:hypothetical protein
LAGRRDYRLPGDERSPAGLALRFWPTRFFGRIRGARFCCYFAVLSKITGIDLFHVLIISVFTALAAPISVCSRRRALGARRRHDE